MRVRHTSEASKISEFAYRTFHYSGCFLWNFNVAVSRRWFSSSIMKNDETLKMEDEESVVVLQPRWRIINVREWGRNHIRLTSRCHCYAVGTVTDTNVQ